MIRTKPCQRIVDLTAGSCGARASCMVGVRERNDLEVLSDRMWFTAWIQPSALFATICFWIIIVGSEERMV